MASIRHLYPHIFPKSGASRYGSKGQIRAQPHRQPTSPGTGRTAIEVTNAYTTVRLSPIGEAWIVDRNHFPSDMDSTLSPNQFTNACPRHNPPRNKNFWTSTPPCALPPPSFQSQDQTSQRPWRTSFKPRTRFWIWRKAWMNRKRI